MASVKVLSIPIADALQMTLRWKSQKLFGEAKISLPLMTGVPVMVEAKIVDAVVDTGCSTAGVILHLGGDLYLGVISDERNKEMLMFPISGRKAGLKLRGKTGSKRLGILDKEVWWSRKKFYEMIAAGVLATFRMDLRDPKSKWEIQSEGPGPALDYVAKRNKEKTSKSANVINAEFAQARQRSWGNK